MLNDSASIFLAPIKGYAFKLDNIFVDTVALPAVEQMVIGPPWGVP